MFKEGLCKNSMKETDGVIKFLTSSDSQKGPPKAPAVHDAAPFTPAGQGITWPLGWYWYWDESFRSFNRWICPRSDKECCPATPGSHPASCLKTCTLEIVWSKSKYTCFTDEDFSFATFGSADAAAVLAFGVASALKTPLKPSGGGGGALPLAAAWQIPVKPVGGGGGTAADCTLDVAGISLGAAVLLAWAASFWTPTMDLNSCISPAVMPFRSDTKTLRQTPLTEAISAASSSTKAASFVLRPAWDISAWIRFTFMSGSWQSGVPSNSDGCLFSWSNSDSP